MVITLAHVLLTQGAVRENWPYGGRSLQKMIVRGLWLGSCNEMLEIILGSECNGVFYSRLVSLVHITHIKGLLVYVTNKAIVHLADIFLVRSKA
jgi:hypothetical protein